jgi:hypothetical protein
MNMSKYIWGLTLISLFFSTSVFGAESTRKFSLILTGKVKQHQVSGHVGSKTKQVEPGGDHRALWMIAYSFVGEGPWGPRRLKLTSMQMNTLKIKEVEDKITTATSFATTHTVKGDGGLTLDFINGIQVCTSKENQTIQQVKAWSRAYLDTKPTTFNNLRTWTSRPREPCSWRNIVMCDSKSVAIGIKAHYNNEAEGFVGYQLRCRAFKIK